MVCLVKNALYGSNITRMMRFLTNASIRVYTRDMKIHFSNQGMLGNFNSFMKGLDLADTTSLEITTNEKWITVHPAILTFTASLAQKVGKDRATITNNVPASGAYLDRMGLYDFLSTPSPFSVNRREEAGRFIPLTIVKSQSDQSQFISNMVPLLHLPQDKADVIKYVIGELVRNVLEHSQSPDGAIVAAQYYKKSNRISIGICDTGIGIWRSMNEHWHPKTDLEAIELALTPGITGTTNIEGGTADNAGAGLFFIKSISKITRDYFLLYSGKGQYRLLKSPKRLKNPPKLSANPNKDNHSSMVDAPDFSGTLVGVDISLDNNRALEALLRAISKVYDDAIRERKRKKYKEPRFI